MEAKDLTLSRVSSRAVREATGLGWPEWIEVLDNAGAREWSHKELVAHLERAHADTTTGWWRQSIAVGYEQARGGRIVGQTRAAGFQLGVQKTIELPLQQTWDLLVSRPDLWLGPDARVSFEKGAGYEVPSSEKEPGASGELRVVKPLDRVRMTWQPRDWPSPATLQVTVTATRPDRTAVHVHLEKLPDAEAREQLRGRWRSALERFASAAAES